MESVSVSMEAVQVNKQIMKSMPMKSIIQVTDIACKNTSKRSGEPSKERTRVSLTPTSEITTTQCINILFGWKPCQMAYHLFVWYHCQTLSPIRLEINYNCFSCLFCYYVIVVFSPFNCGYSNCTFLRMYNLVIQ